MQTQQKRRSKEAPDAIALLIEDHKKIQKLFKEFEKLKGQDDDVNKQTLVQMICTELTIHALIEEEIFYPTVRDALDVDDLFDEAEVEHASAKEMIAQLEAMEPYDELYDAKVTVLGEYINHHIKEEQEKMFPKVIKAKLDMHALSTEMLASKQELNGELGMDQPPTDSDDNELSKEPAYRPEKGHSPGARTH